MRISKDNTFGSFLSSKHVEIINMAEAAKVMGGTDALGTVPPGSPSIPPDLYTALPGSPTIPPD